MLADRLSARAQLAVAAVFSLAVGLVAGGYGVSARNAGHGSSTMASVPAVFPGKVHCPEIKPQRSEYEYKWGDYLTGESRLDWWKRHLPKFSSEPLSYLEVGVYEGRSMVWMLENVLKHPDSTAVGLDVALYPQYMENLVRTGACEKVTNVIGRSQDTLHLLPKESFDVIYVDGSHLGKDVLVDAVLAFDRLKVGGVMIFDDYNWHTDWAAENRPGVAIQSFVTMYRQEIDIVHRDYQLVVQRRPHPCAFDIYHSTPVGRYCYQWTTGQFVSQSDRNVVELSEQEKKIIAAIARSAAFGETAPGIPTTLRSSPELQALNRRLAIFPE